MAPFDRQKCILFRSKCDHHTTVSVSAHCGFFKLNAIVDGTTGILCSLNYFYFIGGKIGVELWRGVSHIVWADLGALRRCCRSTAVLLRMTPTIPLLCTHKPLILASRAGKEAWRC